TDATENQLDFVPRADGFWTLTVAWPDRADGGERAPVCSFFRELDGSGRTISALATEPVQLTPNPLGGYVEARGQGPCGAALGIPCVLEVRWVDERLQPLGDWHEVIRFGYFINDF